MRYNIIWNSSGGQYPDFEVVDKADNRIEAIKLVKEYQLAFKSNKITFKRI